MKMEVKKGHNIAKLVSSYESKWVALSPDYKKVLANGKTLRAVHSKVKETEAIFMKVLPSDVRFAPYEVQI